MGDGKEQKNRIYVLLYHTCQGGGEMKSRGRFHSGTTPECINRINRCLGFWETRFHNHGGFNTPLAKFARGRKIRANRTRQLNPVYNKSSSPFIQIGELPIPTPESNHQLAAKFDWRIDALVCQLYDLTDEEIVLVEGS
jgi:hypothetical protein